MLSFELPLVTPTPLITAHSLAQTERISYFCLCSRLPKKQLLLLPLLRTLLLTLRTVLKDGATADDTLYPFHCTVRNAHIPVSSSNPYAFLRYFRPDKNPTPEDFDVQAAAPLVPLITHLKCVLGKLHLCMVYDHRGLPGLWRLLSHRHCSFACLSMAPGGWPFRQGKIENPQLLFSITPHRYSLLLRYARVGLWCGTLGCFVQPRSFCCVVYSLLGLTLYST